MKRKFALTEVWTLVFINLMFNGQTHEPTVEGYWNYETMIECFEARSTLGFEFSGVFGSFPKGSQAVCIPRIVEPTL